MREGHDESSAIAIAVSATRRWAAGQTSGGQRGHVHPEVRAAGASTQAEWERLRAAHHTGKCLTCGCHRPDDEHGDERHFTLHDLQDAAEAAGISSHEAVENIVDTTRAFPVKGNPWAAKIDSQGGTDYDQYGDQFDDPYAESDVFERAPQSRQESASESRSYPTSEQLSEHELPPRRRKKPKRADKKVDSNPWLPSMDVSSAPWLREGQVWPSGVQGQWDMRPSGLENQWDESGAGRDLSANAMKPRTVPALRAGADEGLRPPVNGPVRTYRPRSYPAAETAGGEPQALSAAGYGALRRRVPYA